MMLHYKSIKSNANHIANHTFSKWKITVRNYAIFAYIQNALNKKRKREGQSQIGNKIENLWRKKNIFKVWFVPWFASAFICFVVRGHNGHQPCIMWRCVVIFCIVKNYNILINFCICIKVFESFVFFSFVFVK